jgi:hypothetical protein
VEERNLFGIPMGTEFVMPNYINLKSCIKAFRNSLGQLQSPSLFWDNAQSLYLNIFTFLCVTPDNI